MKISIFGATGLTGGHIVKLALDAGDEVTALARDPSKVGVTHPKLRVVQGDGTVAADVERAIAGQDAVIAAIGARTRKANTVRSDMARNADKRPPTSLAAGPSLPGAEVRPPGSGRAPRGSRATEMLIYV